MSHSLQLFQAAEKDKARSPQQVDTQLLLGQMRLDAGQPDKAARLLEPLVDPIKAGKIEDFDVTTTAIFTGTVRANVMLGRIDRAAAIGQILLEAGPDNPQTNAVLVEFARSLSNESGKIEIDISKLGDDQKEHKGELLSKLAGMHDTLAEFVVKLLAHQQNSIGGLVYLADTCTALGPPGQGRRRPRRRRKKKKKLREQARRRSIGHPGPHGQGSSSSPRRPPRPRPACGRS